MKRILAILALSLALAAPAAAQFGGRIGSGVPNIKKLVEKSTLTFTAPIRFDGPITISSTVIFVNTTGFVRLDGDIMTGNLNVPEIGISTDTDFSGLFQVGDGTFTVLESGFIGIGESNPRNHLTIKGTIGTEPLLRIKAIGTPNEAHIMLETDTQIWGWHIESGDDSFKLHDETGPTKTFPFIVQPDAPNNSFFIKSDGNIGLGTNNPGAQLEVAGEAIINNVRYFGSKTTAELQALVCPTLPCQAHNSNDFDIYTATGTAAGQWRNSRLGTGPGAN